MNEMLAYCGLVCTTCPIYLATKETDKEKQAKMRADIVKLCNEQWCLKYELKDITDCDGCLAEKGRLFSACKKCPIRICARKKKVENCAYCPDYACDILQAFFDKELPAEVRLNKIRSKAKSK